MPRLFPSSPFAALLLGLPNLGGANASMNPCSAGALVYIVTENDVRNFVFYSLFPILRHLRRNMNDGGIMVQWCGFPSHGYFRLQYSASLSGGECTVNSVFFFSVLLSPKLIGLI
jgi:hypothetical protein